MSMQEIGIMVYALTGVLYILILHTYFHTAFDLKNNAAITAAAYITIYIVDITFLYVDNQVLNIFLSVLMFSGIILLYAGNLKARIIAALFIYTAVFISDAIAAFAIQVITKVPLESFQFGSSEFTYGTLLSKLFLIIFAKILASIVRRRASPKFTHLHWFALVITPVGSFFVLYNLIYDHADSILNTASAFIVILINFIVIHVYDKMLSNYETDTKNKVLEEQIKYYRYHTYIAEASDKLIRKTRHDMKNLLIGIKSGIQSQQFDYVENHVNELLGRMEFFEGPVRSGNIAIDAIINFKADTARQKSILFSPDIRIPGNLDVDPTVVCQVLGNALDNAIEATEMIADTRQRIVQIFMSYQNKALFLQIENPYEGVIATDTQGNILSAKRKHRSEGIGLQSIRSVISEEQGATNCSYEDGRFKFSLLLYNIQAEMISQR